MATKVERLQTKFQERAELETEYAEGLESMGGQLAELADELERFQEGDDEDDEEEEEEEEEIEG